MMTTTSKWTILMIWLAATAAVTFAQGNHPTDWYKKYPAYPPYCSTPTEMKKRSIPPLADDAKLGATRLVHVTSIIRHGARTPLSSCWMGTGRIQQQYSLPWNCNLTTIVTTPTPNEMSQVEGLTSKNPDMLQLSVLEKRYDALDHPNVGLSNTLNGTCQFGQLLLQGYEQEVTNGIHLRNAYLFDGESYEHDERMRLINLSLKNPFADPSVRYRSDDDQRTVMSGQIVLQGMFGPELHKATKQNNGQPPIIPVHVADRDRDVLASNEAICPRLTELRDQLETSKEFRAFNQSADAQRLRRFMKKNLGRSMDSEAIDCLMTTICNDRPLPNAIDDYGRKPNRTKRARRQLHNGVDDGDEAKEETAPRMFQSIFDFFVKRNSLYLNHNDAESAKLAMGPLWAEIMDNIDHVVDPKAHTDSTHTPAKFALFSGHDSTIMPLLATLGPRVWDATEWPPYASMVLLEIHEIIDGKTDRSVFKSTFAFRLVYNGKVITNRMDGCPQDSELCDVQVLLQRIKPFATRSRNCARKTKSIFISSTPNAIATVESGNWFMYLIALVCGMALGSILTVVYLRRSQQQHRGNDMDDAEGRMSLTRSTDLQLYSDEPESLYGHDAGGKTAEFEAAAIDATLA